MNIITVLSDDQNILRQVAEPVTEFNDELKAVVKSMFDTLRETNTGIALAANQVGILKRIFVMDTTDHPDTVIINPEIIEATGRIKFDEGCLSIPNKIIRKKRKSHIVLKYYDEKGTEHQNFFIGKDAVVVQHETDHLNGILMED